MSKTLATRLIHFICLGGKIPKEDIILDFLEQESKNISRSDIDLLFSLIDTTSISLEQFQRVSAARLKYLPSSRSSSVDSSFYVDAQSMKSSSADQDNILRAFGVSTEVMDIQPTKQSNQQTARTMNRHIRRRSTSPNLHDSLTSLSLYSIDEDMEKNVGGLRSMETISEEDAKLPIAYFDSNKLALHSQKSRELISRVQVAREQSTIEDRPVRIGGPRKMPLERMNSATDSDELNESPVLARKLGLSTIARIQKLFKYK